MRDLVRIGGGVALGVGLLVAAGARRDSPAPPTPAAVGADSADDADDVEAPVPRPPSAAASPAAPTPPATQPAAQVPGPPARAGWRAGAHPPQEIPPSMVVKAARRRAAPKACAQPANGAAAPACPTTPPRPAVEIQWNAPGSMP